jgi:hypothetical protein
MSNTAVTLLNLRELRALGYQGAARPGDEINWQGRAILVLPF